MKIYRYFTVFFIILGISYSQTYWIQHPSPANKELKKCFFIDSLYGWVIGDSGTVIRTTNGGFNWTLQQSNIFSSEINDICFTDRNNGWIITLDSLYKTMILKTTNSGISWAVSFYPDTTLILNTIWFTDQQTGFVSGLIGKIFKTTNSGLSWFECGMDTTSCLYLFPKHDILFINSQTGFASGGALDIQGIMLKTTNAGIQWVSQCISSEPINKIQYFGGNTVRSVGGDFDLGAIFAVTTNLGVSWTYDTIGCFGNATGFSFRTQTEVWAALSFNRTMAVNQSAMVPGSTWQCIPNPNNIAVNDVHFINSTTGWAFGSGGAILKYNEAVIIVGELQNNLPQSAVLYQNYPNPFNPETRISYEVYERSEVRITVYDLAGRVVSSYDEGLKQPGKYSITFIPGNLASSVYYYQLTVSDITITKKMVLLK